MGRTRRTERSRAFPSSRLPALPPPRPLPPPAPAQGPCSPACRNMNESLGVPTATTFRELSVAALEARRRDLNSALRSARRTGEGFLHAPDRACDRGGGAPTPGHGAHLCRVGRRRVPGDSGACEPGPRRGCRAKDGSRGLVVPVIQEAERLSFRESTRSTRGWSKGRGNKLMPDAFAGATMSLTNPGGLGTSASVPRLMPGQGSIIAVEPSGTRVRRCVRGAAPLVERRQGDDGVTSDATTTA